MPNMPELKIQRPDGESSYRVILDLIELADGRLWLHNDDNHPDRKGHLWDSVLIDLAPEQDGQKLHAFRVTESLSETGPILFSKLEDACRNAAYRCAQILGEPVDRDELTQLILQILGDQAPHLLQQADPPFTAVRDPQLEPRDCALAN